MSNIRILIVDDEAAIRFGIHDFLSAHGYVIEEAETCGEAEEAFRRTRADAVIADYKLPDGNALDLLPRLKAIDADVPVVILTGHGSIDLAVRAIKEGAEQFLTKPVELPALLVILERVIERQRNRQEQLAGAVRQARGAIDPFLGTSAAIRELAEQAHQVAATESPIFIQGETGTGKGVLAQWLHQHGPRSHEAFIDLNCAGLARELLETELFGHEKGAFTGALTSKIGLLQVAHRGTVFLDEIGDMDLQVQPKLLKVLEEKRFRRLGSVEDRRVDVRLVSATHQNLMQLVEAKRFRSDLYFRIATIPLVVPPLRQRIEDIPILARHLLERMASDIGGKAAALSPQAETALTDYPWPGNIRELRNVLERALLLSRTDVTTLTPQDLRLAAPLATGTDTTDTRLTLQEFERRYIECVLAEEHVHVGRAAVRLGLPRSSLYQKLKKYGIAQS